ncbi:MAG: hypothetical protein K2X46_10130, partial [Roseomonas sp.]|nr:hypothetical protein [Roseomonas sp.]
MLVAGNVHRGWRSMKLSTTLDAPAAKFSVEMAERWAASPDGLARGVKPGAACQLRLDGDLVLDGWLDAVEASYGPRDHALVATGRDKVGDLVDNAAVLEGPHEWRGLRLVEIVTRLATPYGVTVRTDIEADARFPLFAIQPGETAWEAVDRAARARGVLVVGDGLGGLLLTRAAKAGPAAGIIQMGANVLECRATFDHSERHSVVAVRSQSNGQAAFEGVQDITDIAHPRVTEGAAGLIRARLTTTHQDTGVARYRPRVL